ncbi:DUF4230 domain-containing protein [Marispirochaeta sp.]|jgi:hypothetical protein|uniref:DUF4230 domain-containing protein n=1 Tax=Marispirochaeta sp. TaxID=2038653 RepID=UPI0029C67481|nr:DUF4230 domain-containing protein [Marispirochaeta sp.]
MSRQSKVPVFSCLLICILVTIPGCSVDSEQHTALVRRQIREVLEVPSYEHIYREVIYLGKENTFLGFRTLDQRLLFAVDMRVQAGIRLDRGFDLRLRGSNRIEVLLPAAEILLIDADEESIEQFFLLERGDSITHTEYYDEIELSKDEVREDAIRRGILRKAEENAQTLIRGILSGAGYKEIRFISSGEKESGA